MKVLSVRQPWAWALIHGGKDVENRTWRTSYRGPLAIHAGSRFDMSKAEWHNLSVSPTIGEPWHSMARGYNAQSDHVLGAIIGIVDLVDCLPSWQCDSPWKADPDYFCWKVANPRALEVPVLIKGQLGLFDVPDALLGRLVEVKR